MKKIFYLVTIIFVLTACGTTDYNHDEDINAVYPSEAETSDRDFVYRLFTEKDVYEEFGDTAVFAELTYVGKEESIEIYHAASPFYFPLEERTRGYKIDYAMDEPLLTTTLKKDEPLREKYNFAGGYSDSDNQEYVEFIETVVNEGFPEGNYIINGSARFSVKEPGNSTDEESFNMNINIGFTVNKKIQ